MEDKLAFKYQAKFVPMTKATLEIVDKGILLLNGQESAVFTLIRRVGALKSPSRQQQLYSLKIQPCIYMAFFDNGCSLLSSEISFRMAV